jgi:hypothetical protein
MNALWMRRLALCALLLLALAASGCSNYRTIGAGPEGVKVPTKPSARTPTPKGIPKSAQQATTAADNAVSCQLSNLTPAATWTSSGDALVGSLTLANYWDVPCTLRGQPTLGLTDDSGVDFALQTTEPTASLNPPSWLFAPNTVGEIKFTWLNWCYGEKGTMRVSVSMAGLGQPVLYVPVRDAGGNLLSSTPPCTDKAGGKSTFTVEGLRIIQ